MTITCTQCSSRYVLPPHLVGPHGARVRCPVCGQAFVVMPDGSIPTLAPVAEPVARDAFESHAAPAAWAEASEPPAAVATHEHPVRLSARELVLDLDDPPGTMARAAAGRRLFSELGPQLVVAFERCRSEAGEAGEAEFRRALSDATGVDFEPPRIDP